MELDYRQTRRLYLAGTTPFPMPFPTVGAISLEDGKLTYSRQGPIETRLLVIVREEPGSEHATTRIILAKHVSAIFFYAGQGNRVDDFENGEWVLGPYISDEKAIAKVTANFKNQRAKSGIVFVPEHRPVLTINELTKTAGAIGSQQMGYHFGCECCDR